MNSKLITLIIAVALTVVSTQIALADSEPATGRFMGTVQFKSPSAEDGKETKPSMFAGSVINLEGSLLWDEPNLRIEFTQDLTMEAMIVLINYDTTMSTVLFPDTLNGFEVNLGSLPGSRHFLRLREVISSKGTMVPEGWKSVGKPEKDADTGITSHSIKSPNGELLTIFRDSQGNPVAIEVDTDNWSMALDIYEVVYGAKIPADSFTYDKDNYAVRPFDKAEHSADIQL